MIGELIGAPPADRIRLSGLANRLTGDEDPGHRPEPGAEGQAAAAIYAYAGELAARRREQPADDVVTRLLQPDDAGEVLRPTSSAGSSCC